MFLQVAKCLRCGCEGKPTVVVRTSGQLMGKCTSAGKVCVLLRNAAGNFIELESEANGKATIADLKDVVAKTWKIPSAVQEWIVGSAILDDTSKLVDCCEPGVAELSVTLVLTLQRVLAALQGSDDEKGRRNALSALADLGPKGGEPAIAAVIVCLGDASEEVRFHAVRALSRILPQDDCRAIGAWKECLVDPSKRLRYAALRELTKTMTDEAIVTMLKEKARLEDDDDVSINVRAVSALGDAAELGLSRSIEALQELLGKWYLDDRVMDEVVATLSFHAVVHGSHCNGRFRRPD